MTDSPLAWLDTLPDLRVPGVPGVSSQFSAGFSGTYAEEAGVPGVPMRAVRNTSEHPGTPSRVPAKTLILGEEHREHLGTPNASDVVKLEGVPAEWLAKIAALDPSVVPADLRSDRWAQLLSDARTFLIDWGDRAVALGWTEMDLFSVPPGPERWGRGGLIMCLEGRPVVAMTDQTASIPTSCGVGHRYSRREKERAVMLWDGKAFGGVGA